MTNLRLRMTIEGDVFEAEGSERAVAASVDVFLAATNRLDRIPMPLRVADACLPEPEEPPPAPEMATSTPEEEAPTEGPANVPSSGFPETPSQVKPIPETKPRGKATYADAVIEYLRGLIERNEPLPKTMGRILDAAGVPHSSQGPVFKVSLPARGVVVERIKGGCRATFRDGAVIETPVSEKEAPREKRPARRFNGHTKLEPEKVNGLPPEHDAVKSGHTLFPSTVVDAGDSARILVSGQNQRKIGSHVTKGPWKGMPIFTVTLEERATCPETCYHWKSCYGNGMPLARRHRHGPRFEEILASELAEKQRLFPDGFVVRLHVLGDFYGVEYVGKWAAWLDMFPALRVFGYTAHTVFTPIGSAVSDLARDRWDRFAIRFSSSKPLRQGATTIWRQPDGPVVEEGIVCPAQLDEERCCGNCGLCWAAPAREKTIVFVAHGRAFKQKPETKPLDIFTPQFLVVVTWLRSQKVKIEPDDVNPALWKVNGFDTMTPRAVINIANDRRGRAKPPLNPFVVEEILAKGT